MTLTLSERLSRELTGLREQGLLISPRVLETANRARTQAPLDCPA